MKKTYLLVSFLLLSGHAEAVDVVYCRDVRVMAADVMLARQMEMPAAEYLEMLSNNLAEWRATGGGPVRHTAAWDYFEGQGYAGTIRPLMIEQAYAADAEDSFSQVGEHAVEAFAEHWFLKCTEYLETFE